MENIGVCKVNRDVAIGMSGPVILQGDTRSIELQSPLFIEDVCGNCRSWRGRKGEVPAIHSSCGGKAFFRIRVSEDRCTGRVQPLVTISVIEVPVCIDELFDGIGADRGESRGNLRTRTGEACIAQQLS